MKSGQIALAQALVTGVGLTADKIAMLEPIEPDGLSDALYDGRPEAIISAPILAVGGGRDTLRSALAALGGDTLPETPIALGHIEVPGGAPYGAVHVNQDACTLCLACVGLCPTGALVENPDRPELRFQEDACIQCGLCRGSCPESAITLEARYDVSKDALTPRTLHSEEPFCCVECGAPFGVKSTIERITEKLSGQHWMYTNSDNARLIQMCDDCRVKAQFHGTGSPFQMGERPAVRTTDDYLEGRDRDLDS